MGIISALAGFSDPMFRFLIDHWLGVIAVFLLLLFSALYYYLRSRIFFDWRIFAILIATSVSCLITFALYAYGAFNNTDFTGAIFASWIGNVIFFTIIGVVVAIVSLARPEDEPFYNRARILLGRKSGEHIKYMISRLTDLMEHYSEKTDTTVTIISYDAQNKLFRTHLITSYEIRSYLYDEPSIYIYTIRYDNMTPAPSGLEDNVVRHIKINESLEGYPETFKNSFAREIKTTIAANSSCKVSIELEFWVTQEKEGNNHKTKRYTQRLSLNITNAIAPPMHVVIKLVTCDQSSPISIPLAPGESKLVCNKENLHPGVEAYNFWIHPS